MTNLRLPFIGAVAKPVLTRPAISAVISGVGASLLAVGAVGLAVRASTRVPSPAPIVVTHTISLAEFGLQVTLPSTWTLEPVPSGTGFAATHSETGATLTGNIAVSEPPAPDLDALIDKIIEGQRARPGGVETVSRGVMAVGLLDARWAKFSVPRQGELVRMRTVAVQRGLSTLTLSCMGTAPGQKACDAAIRSVTMAR